ncbi:hypothetical protein V6N13_004626 [Hibiscus sabdariffa]
MERRNPEKGREEGKYSEAEKSNPGERNIARKTGEAEERIPVAGKTVDGKDSKSTKADFERVGESLENKAKKNIEVGEGKAGVTTLFVENIPENMHWKGLWFSFARHGDVVSVFIARKRSRGGKRFGFVRMKEKEDADIVIERLHGFFLYGSRLTVKMANVQRSRRFFPEYSLKADRIRINVSRENGVAKATSLQRSPEEPKRKRIAGHVENEDLWSMERCLVGETATVCSLSTIYSRMAN